MGRRRSIHRGLFLLLVLVALPLSAQDLCWKNSYGRGVGTIPTGCEFSQEKQGLLCYPKCKDGFTGVAFVCWQNCPAGYRDDGAFCAKPEAYGRGAGYPWVFGDPLDDSGMFSRCQRDHGAGNCEKAGAIVYPKCRAGFHAVGSNICSPNCVSGMEDIGVSCTKQSYTRETLLPNCGNQIYDAGLCYQRCNAGYTGVGPVCWGQCPASHPVECGASCTVSQEACAKNVTDQVLSVVEVAADITLTVLTAGGGTAAVGAIKTGVKQGTKVGFSQAAKSLGKNLTKATISEQIKKAAVKAGKEVAESTAEAWGAALVQAGTTGEFEWESLDPTGIASIVAAYNHPICPAPTSASVPTAAPVAAAGPGCNTEGSARSAGGGQAVQLTFRNSTAGPVKLYWLDYNGKRQLYGTLSPGQTYVQSTYTGHPWLAADATDKCLELFQPTASTTLNIITR